MFGRRLPYGPFGLYRNSSLDQSTHATLLGVAKLHETEGTGARNPAPLVPAAEPPCSKAFVQQSLRAASPPWRQAAQQVGRHQQPHAGHPHCLQARPDAFDDKQRSETDFFEYVARSYRFFLAGEDYQSQAVDDEKAQELEERAGEVKLRNQAIQQVGAQTAASSVLELGWVWQEDCTCTASGMGQRGAGESSLRGQAMRTVSLLPAWHGRGVLFGKESGL